VLHGSTTAASSKAVPGYDFSIPRLLQVFGYNLKMINTPMTKLKIFNVCSRCETAEAVLQSLHCL
jgi:hypothetical protein